MKIQQKLQLYQISVIFSMLFALVGFSYNTWRLEVSEYNNNVRLASFEILKELAALEQLLYVAHYDQDMQSASPRKGWIKVGLIKDFSYLTNKQVQVGATNLQKTWSQNWENISTSNQSVELIVNDIDEVRASIKSLLTSLQ
ncbi:MULTISPECIES: hypothetical protein [Pseudoalteromonas]|uniref:Uncharacterized protein n=1 Tax=Pseudoalteromonas luteoviolacea (strain 2ta16) TaxID=1353533 RepID=V4I1Q7_PSEL2|nr:MULTISPECIES: hypothetical protein [Pseudoalteromonas]ESP94174.1 hypothetical protein PL2TA16_02424 [Pseudoalteromonas luteoviolacea 2ta16]KZN38818.1 hypothetical protein N483_00175 [Pseudoalteromonas luteoviolacea NCIMB 1944]MCG7549628.1 hypothetical protein [Pseudoalteromonas sp. Of7M-16]